MYLICIKKEAYSLCGGLWCQAVFAYGQFESVFNLSLQFWARDPQHRAAGAQAEVQGGAVLWTLKREFAAVFFIYVVCLSTKSCSTQSQIHSKKHTCICKLWPKIIGERLRESRPTKISFQYLFQINHRPTASRRLFQSLGATATKVWSLLGL